MIGYLKKLISAPKSPSQLEPLLSKKDDDYYLGVISEVETIANQIIEQRRNFMAESFEKRCIDLTKQIIELPLEQAEFYKRAHNALSQVIVTLEIRDQCGSHLCKAAGAYVNIDKEREGALWNLFLQLPYPKY